MAAKYSTVVNEPIKDILQGHIAVITADVNGDDESAIPVEYFGGKPITFLDDIDKVDGLTVSKNGGKTRLMLSASTS